MPYSSQPAAPSALIASWAAAIYDLEDPTRTHPATRNNNPGNIMHNNVYDVYPTMEAGWLALYSDLTAKLHLYPGWTLNQIMLRFAPDSTNYGDWVANHLNRDLGTTYTGSTTLAELAGGASTASPVFSDSGDSGAPVPPDDNSFIPLSPDLSWAPWAVLGVGVAAWLLG